MFEVTKGKQRREKERGKIGKKGGLRRKEGKKELEKRQILETENERLTKVMRGDKENGSRASGRRRPTERVENAIKNEKAERSERRGRRIKKM